MKLETFGKTPQGDDVHRIVLTGGGLTANVLTWGAVIQDLRLQGHNDPLVLGFNKLEDYLDHSPYFGTIVGRFANRIAHGEFEIDGENYRTDRNFLGKHTLHGGTTGTAQRIWTIGDHTENSVTLILEDPHNTMGFPGNAGLRCTYTLRAHGTLDVELIGITDQPTIINLAHHSYFVLDDSGDCRDHTLQIAASHYLPVDDDMIPTGKLTNIGGTAFDFLAPKNIGQDLTSTINYDHNFCVANARRNLTAVASVRSPKSGISMDIVTTEPGLQFYAGHMLDTPVSGLSGHPYGPFSGIALETQLWPDAPNHSHFPSAVIRPGETSIQLTEYRFSEN